MEINTTRRNNIIISTDALHSEAGTSIPAIATFDEKGNIAPLYFRIKGESHKVLRYVVLNSALGKILTFECTIEDNGYMKPLIVKYYYDAATWVIPRQQRAGMFLSE